MRQVLLERPATLSDRLRCEVPAQLFPYKDQNHTLLCSRELSSDIFTEVSQQSAWPLYSRGKHTRSIWSPWLRRKVAWSRWKSEYRRVMIAGVLSLPPDWITWMVYSCRNNNKLTTFCAISPTWHLVLNDCI